MTLKFIKKSVETKENIVRIKTQDKVMKVNYLLVLIHQLIQVLKI